jgi:hypothetical protein
MKKRTFTFIVLVLLFRSAVLAQPCADWANIFTFSYMGKTYEVVKEMKTWGNAAACAVERGGYLVEINDQAEQNAIYDAIINGASVNPTYTTSPDGGGIAYVWTGATDKVTEGTWLWDGDNNGEGINFWIGEGSAGAGGGSAVAGRYFNWGGTSAGPPKEPDNWNNQDAAGIALAGWPSGTTLLGIAGEWNDISTSNLMYYVIEYEVDRLNDNGLKDFNLFPNPASGVVKIQYSREPIIEVKVFSTLGKVVYQQDCHRNEISMDLRNLSCGVYSVSMYLGNGNVLNRKFILSF